MFYSPSMVGSLLINIDVICWRFILHFNILAFICHAVIVLFPFSFTHQTHSATFPYLNNIHLQGWDSVALSYLVSGDWFVDSSATYLLRFERRSRDVAWFPATDTCKWQWRYWASHLVIFGHLSISPSISSLTLIPFDSFPFVLTHTFHILLSLNLLPLSTFLHLVFMTYYYSKIPKQKSAGVLAV